jgi:hypothetical protein
METIVATGADMRLSDNATTRAIGWLTAWDSQGIHRTASIGDEAGADWLISEATRIGAAPEVEKFTLGRLDPIDVYLELDGERIPGIPVFDAPSTGADGAAGTLGPIGEPGIAVVELSPRSIYTPDYERLRRRAGHHGLVIVCKGEQPGLGLLKAERFRDPYSLPAILFRVRQATQCSQPRLDGHRRGSWLPVAAHRPKRAMSLSGSTGRIAPGRRSSS